VAHQLSIIAQSADHVAIMFMGRIVEQGPVATVFRDSQHPYTRALLAANPQPNPEERLSIEFEQGSLETLPRGGCQYRLRCAYAEPVCENYPPLDPVGPSHLVACIPRPFQQGENRPTTESREASSGPESES